jgi:hypothetical protein
MDFLYFTIAVTIIALVYSFIVRELQYRIGNQKQMEVFQKKSNALAKEMDEASKAKNDKKVDELMKQQGDLMKEMSGLMLGQFKVTGVILVVFFAVTWLVGFIDPTVKDDIHVMLLDNGKECDRIAGDGTFSACLAPTGKEYGAWVVHAEAWAGDSKIGDNSTYFLYNSDDERHFLKPPTGQPVSVSVSPHRVDEGGQAAIYASSPNAQSMKATIDAGTHFYVDLPFTIPILNVSRINEAYWWFIFVAIISGIVISMVMGQLKKGEKK